MQKKKVVLDTDIGFGTDADDAVALAYLLLQPECELHGVTTVGFRSEWRAELADVICGQLNRPDIPITAGADRPLFANAYWPINPVRQWPAAAEHQPGQTYQPGRAVEWLRQAIRQSSGELTLITIGQFTNLATLLLLDPEAVSMLKEIVCMGGRMSYPPGQPRAECNVMLDPVAAGIVFQRLEKVTVVPIDAVRGKGLSAATLDEMLDDESLQPVRRSARGWMEGRNDKGLGLADPGTCAVCCKPDLAACANGRVGVHLYDYAVPDGERFENDEVTGVTWFAADENGGHRLVTDVDKKGTHRHLIEVFRGGE